MENRHLLLCTLQVHAFHISQFEAYLPQSIWSKPMLKLSELNKWLFCYMWDLCPFFNLPRRGFPYWSLDAWHWVVHPPCLSLSLGLFAIVDSITESDVSCLNFYVWSFWWSVPYYSYVDCLSWHWFLDLWNREIFWFIASAFWRRVGR